MMGDGLSCLGGIIPIKLRVTVLFSFFVKEKQDVFGQQDVPRVAMSFNHGGIKFSFLRRFTELEFQ